MKGKMPVQGKSFFCKDVAHKGNLIEPKEIPGYQWNERENFDPSKYKKNQFKHIGDFKLVGQRGRFNVWIVQLDPITTVDALGRVYLAQHNTEAGAEA
jgi:hypothetical protein